MFLRLISTSDRWIGLVKPEMGCINKTKHCLPVMVLGVIASDDNKMLPIFFGTKESCKTSITVSSGIIGFVVAQRPVSCRKLHLAAEWSSCPRCQEGSETSLEFLCWLLIKGLMFPPLPLLTLPEPPGLLLVVSDREEMILDTPHDNLGSSGAGITEA